MKYYLTFIFLLSITTSFSQILTPLKWRHTVTKGADNTYKITFQATIQSSWHTYSQVQPKRAIAQPLALSFNSNPQILLQGRPLEVGSLIQGFDKATKIEDHHYSKTIEV
jgi:thiol:disulfide interchange protein DsbD